MIRIICGQRKDMKAKSRQSGISLTEMTVVVAIVAIVAGFGLPAVRALVKSFETEGGTRTMISSAMASARAIAAKEQRYAGIRFQQKYNPDDPDPLKAPQYMIFIIHDPAPGPHGTGLVHGFRAVEGLEPMKLPETVGVMDLTIVTDRNVQRIENTLEVSLDRPGAALNDQQKDDLINEDFEVRDTATFSIIFSPSGRMVVHPVRVRNKHGQGDSPSYGPSDDDVFNKKADVDMGVGMFYQDDYFDPYPDLAIGPEPSRNRFTIYDKEDLRRAYEGAAAWSKYLRGLEVFYINPYTGTIINR